MDIEVVRVVRLYRFGEVAGPMRGFCDLQFNQDFIITGFKIVEGIQGLFVGMPGDGDKNERYYGQRHSHFVLLSDEIKFQIREVVLNAFDEEGTYSRQNNPGRHRNTK